MRRIDFGQRAGETAVLPGLVLTGLMALGLTFAVLPAGVLAQSGGVLSGRATDTQGKGIPEVQVQVLRVDATGAPEEFTGDGTGAFEATLPAGEYRVTVTHDGFAPAVRTVAVTIDGHRGAGQHAGGQERFSVVLQVARAADSVDVQAEGFKADEAAAATRVPLRLLDTPQQVDVLTGELLRARAAESLKQAVESVPAAGLQLGEGRRDNFFLRGFNAVSDMYLDGIRDTAQYYRDLSNTERIEVVEGPAAVLYGRGSSGGLIDRVSKKPAMEGTLGELSYTAGSYGEQRGTADVDTLVPGTGRTVGFRLTGAAEHEGSQRQFYWMDRYTFAPTLAWHPSEATAVTAQVERLRDDRLPDRGIPYLPATGLPAEVPVGNFYGYVGAGLGSNFIHSAVTDGTIDARHAFASGWRVHANQRLAGYQTNFANMYATAVTALSGGDALVARGEYNGTQIWTTAFSNVEASGKAKWFGLRQFVLVGEEYGTEVTSSTQYNGPTNQTPVSLLHPAALAPVLNTVLARNNRFAGRTNAVYAQDLVTVGSKWKVLAGVRMDDYRQTLVLRPPTNTTPNLQRTDLAWSPRVGVVYQVRPRASLYGNYSRTFDPSGENLSLATNNAQLRPEVTQNYEGGGKLSLLRDRLLATASVFRLDRTGIKTTDPNNPLALLNLGEQRTDGAELNVSGSVSRRWLVYGGYAWLVGRIVSSTTLSSGVSLQGKRPAITPLHNASLWTTYSFSNGWGVSGGLVSRARQFAATDNLAALPAYTRLDAGVFFRRPRYEVQVNLQNLTNRRYFDSAQNDFQIYPAAPISGTGTVRWRF